MSQSVNLPALGESVTEGTVTRWLKNVGDRVEVDEPLVEVSTDKVDTEIPSPIAGVIEAILVQEDETVEVGTALATVGDGASAGDEPASAEDSADEPVAEDAAPEAPAAEEPEVAEVPSSDAPAPQEQQSDTPEAPTPPAQVDEAPKADEAPQSSTGASDPTPPAATPAPAVVAPPAVHQPAPTSDGYVTPLVRRLAQERGVDLSTVSGTGVGGRIRKQDVEAHADSAVPSEGSAPHEVSDLRGTTVPMSRLRKVVAERAVASMQGTAQLTSVVEVDVTKVAALRNSKKDAFLEATGQKLTFLPFFAKATIEALQTYPIINATVDGSDIVYPAQENLSIAVDTERGLLTPVIKDSASFDIAGLARQIADLADRTRNNQLKPDELAGGSFTLTNTGSRGALFDTPVVFLPQSAILGTGIVTKRPVVVSGPDGDSIAIRSMVYLALSYDHRIIDGADASRFLVAVKQRLEEGKFERDLGL